MSRWYVYIVRCADDTLYTGVTTDVERRLAQHNNAVRGAAKYTRARRPVTLVYRERCISRQAACRRECGIKALTKRDKEKLIRR